MDWLTFYCIQTVIFLFLCPFENHWAEIRSAQLLSLFPSGPACLDQTHSFSPSIGYSSACIWKRFYSGVSKHIKSNIIIPSPFFSWNFPFAPFSGKLILLMGSECHEFFLLPVGFLPLPSIFSPLCPISSCQAWLSTMQDACLCSPICPCLF